MKPSAILKLITICSILPSSCSVAGELHEAAKKGDVNLIKTLLLSTSTITNINQKAVHDYTPLLWAATMGHAVVVKQLLNAGATISAKDDFGYTPLHRAASNGHIDVVKILLKASANKEAQTKTKDTPVARAASNGHLEVVKLLLDAGANKDAQNISKWTPLLLAIESEHIEVAKFLIRNGADIKLKTALDVATQYRQSAASKFIFNHLTMPKLIGSTMQKNLNQAKLLLDEGVDINQVDLYGMSALHVAAQLQSIPIAQLLVSHGANLRLKTPSIFYLGNRPVDLVANHNLLKTLLSPCSNVFDAVKEGKTGEVEWFINNKITEHGWFSNRGGKEDVSQVKTDSNSTLLHLAVTHNHPHLVQFLIDKNVPLEAPDSDGKTAIALASQQNKTRISSIIGYASAKKNMLNTLSSKGFKAGNVIKNKDSESKE